MQVIPRGVPRRALASSNVLLSSNTATTTTITATTNVRGYGASSHTAPHATATNITSPPPPSSLPAAPPSSGYARLTTRSLISISGADAPRFLQGIITSSITEPTDHRNSKTAVVEGTPRTRGFYTGFLNATGRVLHDVFIYPDTLGVASASGSGGGDTDPAHAFLIEVDAAQRDALLRHLRRYKLRSRIQVRAVEEGECAVWQAWGTEEKEEGWDPGAVPNRGSGVIALRDPRAPGMGCRILGPGDGDVAAGLQLARCDEAAYRVRRYLLGVPEGQAEIPREQALPLEANLDIMGGIDFRKGCYVGQELTIRTRHRGVVRKRVLPCMLYDYHQHHQQQPASSPTTSSSAATEVGGEGEAGGETPSSPPLQLEYKPADTRIRAEHIPPGLSIGREGKKGRSAGTWLAGVGNVGLALCRLQVMTDVELPGEPPAPAPPPDDDPAFHRREFVMRLDAGGGDGDGDGDGGADGPTVKVKAFVPDWVRERLRG
ncbi:Aminomethyltransferase folate-binding domain-containing protein [Biscogniauxia sp. FL1348]|nr:Aminomethyltransferase folate-binding domain-containing protein [Biscogniauxia sp. FL1348]